MRAMVAEAIGYDAAVYAGLGQHLRGAPPGDYLRATGAGEISSPATVMVTDRWCPSKRHAHGSPPPGPPKTLTQ